MPPDRLTIIHAVHAAFTADPNTLALWLEGSQATGSVDQYSDIDLNVSVLPGTMDAALARVRAALESLGQIDQFEQRDGEDDHLSASFHLAGTSPYLLVDFDAYVDRGSTFNLGDAIEKPLVLFDRAGVVRFVDPGEQDSPETRLRRLDELEATVAQYARVEKYFRRGEYLEAFGYYHRWLLTPLIEALRLRYTPLHSEYYIVHISRHLPAEPLRRLEGLFQVSSLAEMEHKAADALAFFAETAAFLRTREVQ